MCANIASPDSETALPISAACIILYCLAILALIRRSGPPSNNSGVEWYNTGSTADFPSASSHDFSYNTMPGYNTGGANGSFEDEAPLLEGTAPCLQRSAWLHSCLHGTRYTAVSLQSVLSPRAAHACTEAKPVLASLLTSPQGFRDVEFDYSTQATSKTCWLPLDD